MFNIKENIIVVNKINWFIDIFFKHISLYRSALMGVATIWIMLLHGYELYKYISIPLISTFAKRGNVGVDIFLFLSGFGLWFSLSNDKNLSHFLKKRIERVVVPYMILSLPYWIYVAKLFNQSIITFFKNYIGLSFLQQGVVTTWYVFLIIFLYLIYPIIFNLEKRSATASDYILILSDVILCLILYYRNYDLYKNIEIAITRIPGFLMGSLSAFLYKQKRATNYVAIIFIYLTTTILFIVSIFIFHLKSPLSIMMYRFGSIGIAISVMIICCVILNRIRFINLIFSYIGGVSFETYLIHIFIRALLRNNQIGIQNNQFLQCVIWLLVMSSSVVLARNFHEIVNNKILNKEEI